MIELIVWKNADFWMHPVLNIKKLTRVVQLVQSLEEAASIFPGASDLHMMQARYMKSANEQNCTPTHIEAHISMLKVARYW